MQIKKFGLLAGAFGYGALVGWALTADYYNKRQKKTVETITVSRPAREFFLERAEYYPDEYISPENDADEANVTGEDGGDEEKVGEEETEAIRSHLQNIIDAYVMDDSESARMRVLSDRTIDYRSTPPFVISQEEYAYGDEGEYFAKIAVMYYPRERVVLDEDQEIMDDVDNTLGWRNLNRFGDESQSADVVFIRCPRLETDFEVIREEDEPLPLHVKYGMGRHEFEVNKAAGTLRLRDEDM